VSCTDVVLGDQLFDRGGHRFSHLLKARLVEIVVTSFNHAFLELAARLLAMATPLSLQKTHLADELGGVFRLENIFDRHVLVDAFFVE
jgi:hypothetical protein